MGKTTEMISDKPDGKFFFSMFRDVEELRGLLTGVANIYILKQIYSLSLVPETM